MDTSANEMSRSAVRAGRRVMLAPAEKTDQKMSSDAFDMHRSFNITQNMKLLVAFLFNKYANYQKYKSDH